jgi:nitronate monooxygenase
MSVSSARPRFSLDTLSLPVIQAPMAGGPSTPGLAAAVSSQGGLGFLAAGYKTAQSMRAEIEAVRQLTDAPAGVNVFVPQPSIIDRGTLQQYALSLTPVAERFGVALGEAKHDDDDWGNKLDVLLELAPAVVSFTFDVPHAGTVADLQRKGVYVIGTVTSRSEAVQVLAAGVDALCVQGPEAGGHRGTFDATAPAGTQPLHQLLEEVSDLGTTVIAAGGIVTGDETRAALSRGAMAVQAGTAFLCADEAGTRPVHRNALSSQHFNTTAVTKAFSGRYARGLYNEFMRQYDSTAPFGYPEIHHLTSPIRSAAAVSESPEWINLWAGTGFRRTVKGPVSSVLARLQP